VNISQVIEGFRATIRQAGLIAPDIIEPNGKLHRFASNGKPGDWRTGASREARPVYRPAASRGRARGAMSHNEATS
jgi:hypothetical protein